MNFKNFRDYFTFSSAVLFWILILFGGYIWADTNGVWTNAQDIRGGVFGGDEQDVTEGTGFIFANPVTMNNNLTLSQTPTQDGHAATKEYVDILGDNITNLSQELIVMNQSINTLVQNLDSETQAITNCNANGQLYNGSECVYDVTASVSGVPECYGQQRLINNGTELQCVTAEYGLSEFNTGTSCLDILEYYQDLGLPISDGTYWIDADGSSTQFHERELYCDMTSEDGGWTLVVGIDGANQNHRTSNEVTPENLDEIDGYGKLSDIEIEEIDVENVYRLTCGGDTTYFEVTSSQINLDAPSGHPCSLSPHGPFSPSSGYSSHYGLDTWNIGSCTAGSSSIIYSYFTNNGCHNSFGTSGNSGTLWVR